MNLPAIAVEFLDAFIGYATRYASTTATAATVTNAVPSTLASSSDNNSSDPQQTLSSPTIRLPRIHVYGFSSDEFPVRDMTQRAAQAMQCPASALNMGKEYLEIPNYKKPSSTTSGVAAVTQSELTSIGELSAGGNSNKRKLDDIVRLISLYSILSLPLSSK